MSRANSVIFILLLLIFSDTLTVLAQIRAPEVCEVPQSTSVSPDSVRKFVALKQFGLSLSVPVNYFPLQQEDGSVEIVPQGVYIYRTCIAKGGRPAIGGVGYHSISVKYISVGNSLDAYVFKQHQGELIYRYSFRGQKIWLVSSGGGRDDSNAFAYIPIKLGGAVIISSNCACSGALERLTRLLVASEQTISK
jgi:hypothetical protein